MQMMSAGRLGASAQTLSMLLSSRSGPEEGARQRRWYGWAAGSRRDGHGVQHGRSVQPPRLCSQRSLPSGGCSSLVGRGARGTRLEPKRQPRREGIGRATPSRYADSALRSKGLEALRNSGQTAPVLPILQIIQLCLDHVTTSLLPHSAGFAHEIQLFDQWAQPGARGRAASYAASLCSNRLGQYLCSASLPPRWSHQA